MSKRHAPPHATRHLWLIFIILVLVASEVNAQTCEPSSQSHGHSLGLKKYTINYGTLANYGLTRAEGLGSTILAADSWNEHGNTGYFQFVGTDSRTLNTYSGLSSSQCLANGLKESLVVFTDECGPPSQTFAVCGGPCLFEY
jgi:hypothetical protein